MQLIYEPKVKVATVSVFRDYDLKDYASGMHAQNTHSLDHIPEFAGRVCYQSFKNPRPGGNRGYIEHILEVGHGSVLEHSYVGLLITGVSRSLSHELIRHRAGTAFCLAGDTVVYSGSQAKGRFNGVKKRWTIKRLYEMSQHWQTKGRLKLIKVRCFDGERFVQAHIKEVVCSGEKDIVKVTCSDGKAIRCSADHRFLTPSGWMPVRGLAVGNVLAANGIPATGLTREYLYDRYVRDGKLLAEIASESNCSPHTVRSWLRRYKLQKAQGQGMRGRTPHNKGLKYTLGWKHSDEAKSLFSSQKLGDRNPMWKGESASANAGRLRAIKLFPTEPCSVCNHPEGHRHHLDRNTHNNERSNIEFLCNSCHRYRHLSEDGSASILRPHWVEIVSIESDGREMTYDLEVDHPAHNFVANGLVTHNSQLSQRYVEPGNLGYIVPPLIIRDLVAEQCFKSEVTAASASYDRMLNVCTTAISRRWQDDHPDETADREALTYIRKKAREAARSVLPNSIETHLFMSGNLRAWRNILEQRGSIHADLEIRRLAVAIAREIYVYATSVFQDMHIFIDVDGYESLRFDHRKV